MAVIQPILDLVELCRMHGINRAVISPGSRSAALTLAFARNPHIQCTVVMDERAGAFIALGMAQQTQQAVALVCTSGSAAYNFAPAVAEAFFQQIPLLVLTADRPPEWIHQNDGQTIYQRELYGKHVKASFQLPADYTHQDTHWYLNRIVNEAVLTAQESPRGPVHINIPIREPFYPETGELFTPSSTIRKITRIKTTSKLETETWHQLLAHWEDTGRILIAVGQDTSETELGQLLTKIAREFHVPVLGDAISNLPDHELAITRQDLFLSEADPELLRPDLLITCGQSFISKSFKQFIRNHPPQEHWHVSEDRHLIDTFYTLTTQVPVSPEYFFSRLFEDIDYQRFVQNDEEGQDERYLEDWLRYERNARATQYRFLRDITQLTDLTALNYIFSALPGNSKMHVANSMPIRYVNQLRFENEGVKVYCNRGTSGIDGCVSTAIGAALTSSETMFLLVGDVAFFYDRNGLLISELPKNLKIILLNNAGGTIFRLIDGPGRQAELGVYFETRHTYTAQRTAEDSGISYQGVANLENLPAAWVNFLKEEGPALLEITTDPEINESVYRSWKADLKNSF